MITVTIPPLDRTSPTFAADLDTFFLTTFPAFAGEANALQGDVNAKQGTASSAAATATDAANTATAKAGEALSSATTATAAAASAVLAPGTSATSATNLTLGSGAKVMTIQAGKQFAAGQTLVIASTADPLAQMSGVITAHDSTTGAITVQVADGAFSGNGTFAAWTISLTASVVATPAIIEAAGALAVPAAADMAFIIALALS